jgi:hypothetical protein
MHEAAGATSAIGDALEEEPSPVALSSPAAWNLRALKLNSKAAEGGVIEHSPSLDMIMIPVDPRVLRYSASLSYNCSSESVPENESEAVELTVLGKEEEEEDPAAAASPWVLVWSEAAWSWPPILEGVPGTSSQLKGIAAKTSPKGAGSSSTEKL